MFSQNAGEVAKYRPKRNPVSPVMPRRSATIAYTRDRHADVLYQPVRGDSERLHKLLAELFARIDR